MKKLSGVIFGVGGIVEIDGKIVLVQETIPEIRGRWNLPGGRLELGEDITAGAEREVKEETGFLVRADSLVGAYQDPSVLPRANVVCLFFRMVVTGGELRVPEDILDVRVFTPEEIEDMHNNGLLASSSVFEAIKDYRSGVRSRFYVAR